MKSRLQTFAFLVVIAAVVGGVTFVRNWTPSKSGPDGEKEIATTTQEDDTRLTFPVAVTEGLPEFELRAQGRQDFWFQNSYDQDVDLGLQSKSCKCSKIEALILTPDEEKAFRAQMPLAGASEALSGVDGILSLLTSSAAIDTGVAACLRRPDRWNILQPGDETGILIPAKASGIVRLNWEGRAKGPIRLGAKVWAQLHQKAKTRGELTSLEIPINIVDPIRVSPDTITVNYLYPGQSSTVDCLVWSATRAGFSLTAQEKTGDPCFECTIDSLVGPDFREAAVKLHIDPYLNKTTPLTIYRVNTTVHERLPDGRQMDLGPFLRDIIISTDQKDLEAVSVTIAGTVRGDIDVGAGEDRDRIMLRTFTSSKGTRETFPIICRQPDMKLKVDSVTPSYVTVQLTPRTDLVGHYDLQLDIPPNRANGKLPPESAVYLQIQSQPPRRIRIPIVGTASLTLSP
jgi:hypothetical protein